MKKCSAYFALPLRDLVVFPGAVAPLFIKRDKSIASLQAAADKGEMVLLVTQKSARMDNPAISDVYSVGTLASIVQITRLPDGSVKALVDGKKRAFISQNYDFEGSSLFTAMCSEMETVVEDEKEVEALRRLLLTELEQYVKINKKNELGNLSSISQIKNTERMLDIISSHLLMSLELKQEILEAVSLNQRLELVFSYLGVEIEVAHVQRRIWNRVKDDLEKQQKEYVLQMQRKAIDNELGDLDGTSRNELSELEDKINAATLSPEAKEKALSELKKLRYMNTMSSEATVIRNYLDWILSLPWDKPTTLCKDLTKAHSILNKEHYGLDKVKEKILEFLAVQNRTEKTQGFVLCLVGPPGVGKTSLAESIANATGRQFVRFSLGGIKDEAEIRGHRRTYIGAMPGRIIQGMKKAKTTNPLFALDELDKIGQDWRGDPSDALLEVLDRSQNFDFKDHYLEVGYDLSNVMFVGTANSINIPPALLDRMEIIWVSGYTEDEKVEIAKKHLIPRKKEESGLKGKEFTISDEALRIIIRNYCKEAGVRNLEREIASLARKAVKEMILNGTKSVKITRSNIAKYAGVPKFVNTDSELDDKVGVTTGLAWTEMGGDILYIEALVLSGKGNVVCTGKLGEVMQESVKAALSFVKYKATDYNIDPSVFEKSDIHIHVPEGATPKDGPSAGVAMCASMVSALTGIPVRGDIAMTGEISLRGKVLPIGGLKEKLLAALRYGIKNVLIPFGNMKDLEEIPQNVKSELNIIPITTISDVLENSLKKRDLTESGNARNSVGHKSRKKPINTPDSAAAR
ncbi:endopeptidase La [Candidatus Hydrogenosomobacter endosymbioticus]|uniref:endopeptidase La n=1 Tax=Candidatus Hydrogenosomobacter endosymbioticus TaxID=2558174 RepID=UPI001F0084CF|nr:endopeptidase La [Candidatus Hydrogenosomobacter endosymbioticus]